MSPLPRGVRGATIAALIAERYYGRMAALACEAGLTSGIEPYGGPFSTADVAALADVPMDEVWVGGDPKDDVTLPAARAGRTLVAATRTSPSCGG